MIGSGEVEGRLAEQEERHQGTYLLPTLVTRFWSN